MGEAVLQMPIGAQMILDGTFSKPGIANPADSPYDLFLQAIRKRGLDFTRKIEVWDGSEELGGR